MGSTLWESGSHPILALRWYGLSYLMGFLLGWFLIRWLACRRLTETPKEKISDLIFVVALFGVFLGGRLGYLLLYTDGEFFRDPMMFFKFLEGGMASHGGIVGVMLATFFFAWKNKLSWTGVGDDIVVAAPLGLLTGRLANFINGELWGRKTDASWGVKFPSEIREVNYEPSQFISYDQHRELSHTFIEKGTSADGEAIGFYKMLDSDEILDKAESLGILEPLLDSLPVRHPSQLYEAATEGLLLFLILLVVKLTWKNMGHGILTGLFFILYAVFRIFCELYREPDASFIMGVTRGQFYSIFMIGIGMAFIAWGLFGGGRRSLRSTDL